MKYLCLVYAAEGDWEALGPEDRVRVYERYGALERELAASGRMLEGAELQPTATATTVRVRNGETLVADGPFAETREQLGGFFLLDCVDVEEALAVARRIPAAERGAIEVRPQYEPDEAEAAA